MPVIGLTLFALGLVAFALALVGRYLLPSKGMDAVYSSETVDTLDRKLRRFNMRVKLVIWLYVLSSVLLLAGGLIILVW